MDWRNIFLLTKLLFPFRVLPALCLTDFVFWLDFDLKTRVAAKTRFFKLWKLSLVVSFFCWVGPLLFRKWKLNITQKYFCNIASVTLVCWKQDKRSPLFFILQLYIRYFFYVTEKISAALYAGFETCRREIWNIL